MNQLHHQKAKSGFEFPVAALDPEEFFHQWQARTSKILHAQERIAQGIAAAMRAQLRFGQEFMVTHMNMMQWEVADAEHLSAQARKDIDNFAALLKEVSGEIRDGFIEANKMLETKPLHKLEETVAETTKPVAAHPAPKAEPPTDLATASAAGTSKPVAAHTKTEAPSNGRAAPESAFIAAKAAPASMRQPASRARPKA